MSRSRDICGFHRWGRDANGICWVDARDASKHTTHGQDSCHHRELFGPKSPWLRLRNPSLVHAKDNKGLT